MEKIHREVEHGPYRAKILAIPVPPYETNKPAGFVAHCVISRADGGAVIQNFREYASGEIRSESDRAFPDMYQALNAGERWAYEVMNSWHDRAKG